MMHCTKENDGGAKFCSPVCATAALSLKELPHDVSQTHQTYLLLGQTRVNLNGLSSVWVDDGNLPCFPVTLSGQRLRPVKVGMHLVAAKT